MSAKRDIINVASTTLPAPTSSAMPVTTAEGNRCQGARLRFSVCSAMQNVVLWFGTEIWAFIGA
jgi:hypothetical protein